MTEKFAIYIPGARGPEFEDGWRICKDFREAAFEARDELWKMRIGARGPAWPPDIAKLGVYSITAPGASFWYDMTPGEIEARVAAGVIERKPLLLAIEVPGSRKERWPCTHCDGHAMTDHVCEQCSGVGYVDQFGEPWDSETDVGALVNYELAPPIEDEDPLGFPKAVANGFAIMLGLGAVVWIVWRLLQAAGQ